MKMILCFIFLFSIITGIGNANQPYLEDHKTYVSPEQIAVTSEGIFVISENEFLQIHALMQDNQGIYYLRPKFYWTCKICGYSGNPPWTNYCHVCKSHYSEGNEEES